MSFNRLRDVKRASLHGSSDSETVGAAIRTTVHGNLLVTTDAHYGESASSGLRRGPLLRRGQSHMSDTRGGGELPAAVLAAPDTEPPGARCAPGLASNQAAEASVDAGCRAPGLSASISASDSRICATKLAQSASPMKLLASTRRSSSTKI